MDFPVNITVLHKETIKPSSPTPDTKKTLKLSLFDQLAPGIFVQLTLFYPKISNYDKTQAQLSQSLKTSLSKTLVDFYPFAGRIVDNSYVDCNDSGAEFIEAQVSCCMSDFLQSPDLHVDREFLPIAAESSEAVTDCLLLVKATFFSCGGVAIGLCISHKVCDAATMSTFIKCWSAVARGDSSDEVAHLTPVFMGDTLFPQLEVSVSPPEFELSDSVMKRFLFDASNIATLKAKAATTSGAKPTSVVAVSALVWRCLTKASREKTPGRSVPSVMSLTVNLRKRFVPPLPENYTGNCLAMLVPQIHEQIEYNEVVERIKKEIQRINNLDVKTVFQGEFMEVFNEYAAFMAGDDDIDLYTLSSWCKFGLYEADFGFGNPNWLGLGDSTFQDIVILIDTKDGQGIEAWVILDKDQMALFESDQELLQFATINPPVTC